MSVSDRYLFGSFQATAAVTNETVTNGMMIIHLPRQSSSKMSSGLYFFPGSTTHSPSDRGDAPMAPPLPPLPEQREPEIQPRRHTLPIDTLFHARRE